MNKSIEEMDHSLEVEFLKSLTKKDYSSFKESSRICEKLMNNEEISEDEEETLKNAVYTLVELQKVQKLQDWKNEQEDETRILVKAKNLLHIKIIHMLNRLMRWLKIRKDGGKAFEI